MWVLFVSEFSGLAKGDMDDGIDVTLVGPVGMYIVWA